MIIDHISNREKYYFLGEGFRTALDFFAEVNATALEKTNLSLDNGVVVKIRPMMTKPQAECSFEAHREYADIHFLAYGEEKIGYADVTRLHELSYNAESDAVALSGEGDALTMRPGYFMITLPRDAHMPCIAVNEPVEIGKMIAKIKV